MVKKREPKKPDNFLHDIFDTVNDLIFGHPTIFLTLLALAIIAAGITVGAFALANQGRRRRKRRRRKRTTAAPEVPWSVRWSRIKETLPDFDLQDIDNLLPDGVPEFELLEVGLPAIELPEIDLPFVDLPQLDLPDFDLFSAWDLPEIDFEHTVVHTVVAQGRECRECHPSHCAVSQTVRWTEWERDLMPFHGPSFFWC